MVRELTVDEQKAFAACESARRRDDRRIRELAAFWAGQQPMQYMSRELAEEIGQQIKQMVIAIPELVVDAYESRLDVEGFRFPGAVSGDEELWGVWQANDLDEKSQLGHLDAIGLGRSVIIVGPGDEPGVPLVTVEEARAVGYTRDPRSRRVDRAVKQWTEDGETHAVLYLPGRTLHVVAKAAGRVVVDEYPRGFEQVPVVPLVNRPKLGALDGQSEFAPLMPIVDGLNKIATDMMQAAEYHAMPRRWVFGIKKSDFVDPVTGKMVSPWTKIAGRIWANENKDVKVGQFEESSLSNFHETIKLLVQSAAMIAALPPHYLTFVGDNPASADAIRSSESQMVKRVERKHTHFGGAWEDMCRLVLRFQGAGDDLPAEASRLETVWRDPATPTVAQKADAAMKLATARTPSGLAVVPLEQARIDLGYSPAQRAEMQRMDDEARRDGLEALVPAVDRLTGAAG